MTDQDIIARIETELVAVKHKQVVVDKKHHTTYHSGTSTFDLLDIVERIRKRRVELEDALRVIEELK